MHIFTVVGTYDYECTLFDHADTQFGTIIVLNPDAIEEVSLSDATIVFPNPTSSAIKKRRRWALTT